MADRNAKLSFPVRACRAVAGVTDELRDLWRRREDNAGDDSQLTVSQKRMVSAVLRLTEKKPAGITLSELSSQLALSSSAASVMVESLVRKQWLLRNTSTEDRRMVLISISEQGRKRMKLVETFYQKQLSDFFDSVPEEERTLVLNALEGFLDYLLDKNQAEVK